MSFSWTGIKFVPNAPGYELPEGWYPGENIVSSLPDKPVEPSRHGVFELYLPYKDVDFDTLDWTLKFEVNYFDPRAYKNKSISRGFRFVTPKPIKTIWKRIGERLWGTD